MNGGCIASHVPGRLRVRHPDLCPAAAAARAAAELAAWPGILAAEARPACGSVILRYDLAMLSPDALEAGIRARFESERADTGEPAGTGNGTADAGEFSLWSLNRPAKLGMLGSLGGALLALSVGKKAHAVLGAMHVAFLLVHLANHRKKILQ